MVNIKIWYKNNIRIIYDVLIDKYSDLQCIFNSLILMKTDDTDEIQSLTEFVYFYQDNKDYCMIDSNKTLQSAINFFLQHKKTPKFYVVSIEKFQSNIKLSDHYIAKCLKQEKLPLITQ